MRFLMTLTAVLALTLAGCGATGDTIDSATGGDVSATDTADGSDGSDGSNGTDAAADEPDTADGSSDSNDRTEGAADTDEPADAGEDPGTISDCSAAGLDDQVTAGAVTEEARATAELLLDAAVRCDEQLLHTAATESETSFMFGGSSVDELFALPEDGDRDPAPWEALARLLAATTPVVDGDIATWPAAFGEDADDAAWQELVTSGLYDQAAVDELRAAPDGYLGWRVGIHADGSWMYMTAGD